MKHMPQPNQYPDQHTEIRRQLVRDAERAARESSERRQMDAETDRILELIAYGLGILILMLLIGLVLTPA